VSRDEKEGFCSEVIETYLNKKQYRKACMILNKEDAASNLPVQMRPLLPRTKLSAQSPQS